MMRVQGKLLGGAVTHDISNRGVRLQIGTSEYNRLSEPPAVGSACSVAIYPPRRWEPIQLEGSIKRVAPLAPDEHGAIDDVFIEFAREFPSAHMFRSVIAVVGQAHQKLESIRAIIEEECDIRGYAGAEDLLDDLRRRSSPNLVIGSDAGLLRALAPHRHLLEAEILLTEDDTASEVPP